MALSEAIAASLNHALTKIERMQFSDGELCCQVEDNVRGKDVFIIQSTCPPVNDHVMELLIMIDAVRRSSAKRITALLPYYGYSRQDKKDKPRVPITSKLVANLIVAAGASRILTLDLHAPQIQGYFDIPVDHLTAAPVFVRYMKRKKWGPMIVVSPDAGGVERARKIARRIGADLAIIDKRRDRPNVAEVMNVIGDVDGKTTLLLDDMIDTAGTMTKAAEALKKAGSTRVLAMGTHAVLSGQAIERINNSCLEQVIVTNSIPLPEKTGAGSKFHVLSIAELLGKAIINIHNERSVSSLFK
jgi:ribose-phosphate pyrophosphokinase